MMWTLRIEDEDGVPQLDEFLILEGGGLPTGGRFPICSMIELAPHHDTLLNPVQAKILISELDSDQGESSAARAALRNFVLRANEPHMYIRFIGD